MTQHTNERPDTNRRNILLGAGLLAGAAATVGRAQAQTTPTPTATDLNVLNFALTLEHLEAAFYTQGLGRFSAADFQNSALARVLGTGVVNGVYTNLGRIRDHEVAHVEALRTAIRGLGGTPVEPCTYNFTYANPDQFLQVAATLEETGVMAYDGAIAMLSLAALKTAGATIATVEGRHAAYLQLLISNIPFPKAFDEAKTMQEILAIAAPFLASCPTTPPPAATTTTAVLLPKMTSTVNRQVQFDATQSTSANGQPLRYSLRVISGSAAVLQGDTARPSVQFTGPGDYVLELTVTDSTGATATDRATIRYAGT